MGIVLNCENRTGFKQSFFAGIFFSKNSKRKTAIKKAFEELFPTVANAIYSIKQNDYTEFPVKLQKLEASVIIKVLARLNKMGIKALSIHDSIVVNSEAALKIAEELILNELVTKYNINAKFKSEKPIQTLPPCEKTVNENSKLFSGYECLMIENDICYLGEWKINIRTLKGRYHNSGKSYQFKKERIIQMINNLCSEAI